MTMKVLVAGTGCSSISALRALVQDVARRQDQIILADAQGRRIGQVKAPAAPQTAPVKYWNCKNCGHMAEQTPQLKELSFKWVGPLTSKTSCPNCGSYTLQQAYTENFKAGHFLVVKTHNSIRGKG